MTVVADYGRAGAARKPFRRPRARSDGLATTDFGTQILASRCPYPRRLDACPRARIRRAHAALAYFNASFGSRLRTLSDVLPGVTRDRGRGAGRRDFVAGSEP